MRKAVVSASAIVCFVWADISLCAQDRPRTTGELVQLALERNRDVLATRQRVAEAQGLLRTAGVRPSPTVEATVESGAPLGNPGDQEYSASYFQPIEIGGKRGKRQSVGQIGVALAELEVAERIRELSFDVKSRAAEARAARAKSEAFERLLATSQESLRLTRARVSEGDAAPLEEQLLSTEIARVQAQRATFRGRAASTLLDLRRVIGLGAEPLALAMAAVPDRSFELSSLIASANEARPDLRVARLAETQATAEIAVVRSQGIPDITISATYLDRKARVGSLFGLTAEGTAAPILDSGKTLTIGVAVPLFIGGRNRGSVETASSRATAARLRREYLQDAVPSEVEAAYERWTSARQTIALFRQGVVDQSERNLAVMREAYGLGELRLLDVLNEQRRLIDIQLAYIDAETELAQAAAEVERAVGTDLP